MENYVKDLDAFKFVHSTQLNACFLINIFHKLVLDVDGGSAYAFHEMLLNYNLVTDNSIYLVISSSQDKG